MRAEGREVQVAALFRTEYASLASLAALITGDRALADDIVMDAFVKLYAKWGSLGSIDRPEFYVKAMVVNLCRSKLRRGSVERRVNALFHRTRSSIASEQRPMKDPELWDAVQKLPLGQRTCVLLHYVEDMRESDIAELMGRSVGTIKSQLHHARGRLHDQLGPSKGESDDRT